MLGKQFGDDQFTWLMQWTYCGIWEAKEDKVRRNLVGARNLEGLGALGRLGLEGLFAIYVFQFYFLVDHLIAWRAVVRFFAEFFSFFFDNTCQCYLCVYISLSLLFTF